MFVFMMDEMDDGLSNFVVSPFLSNICRILYVFYHFMYIYLLIYINIYTIYNIYLMVNVYNVYNINTYMYVEKNMEIINLIKNK